MARRIAAIRLAARTARCRSGPAWRPRPRPPRHRRSSPSTAPADRCPDACSSRSRSSRSRAKTSPAPPRRMAPIGAIVIRPMTLPATRARRAIARSASGVKPAFAASPVTLTWSRSRGAAALLGARLAPAERAGSTESTEWMTSKPRTARRDLVRLEAADEVPLGLRDGRDLRLRLLDAALAEARRCPASTAARATSIGCVFVTPRSAAPSGRGRCAAAASRSRASSRACRSRISLCAVG